MSTRNDTPQASEPERHRQTQIAAMVEHLKPHAGSLASLWEAMPGAFLVAFGREVNRTNAHDLMLCHAALAPFQMEDD